MGKVSLVDVIYNAKHSVPFGAALGALTGVLLFGSLMHYFSNFFREIPPDIQVGLSIIIIAVSSSIGVMVGIIIDGDNISKKGAFIGSIVGSIFSIVTIFGLVALNREMHEWIIVFIILTFPNIFCSFGVTIAAIRVTIWV